MNQSDMLQRMCHAVLASADLKAIGKSRGFPQAATNPGILAGLFLTEQGLADAFKSLGREEIAVLHLLKAINQPVNVSFFERLYAARKGYGLTFTQKYQPVLAKVKERLVRRGILLMSDVRGGKHEAKLELWRFVLPAQFQPRLPPLLESVHTFDGPGNWRPDAVRQKIRDDLGRAAEADSADAAKKGAVPLFRIADGELHLGNARFRARQVAGLQLAWWAQQLGGKVSKASQRDAANPALDPATTVYHLLGSLGEHQWADPQQLEDLARAFAGKAVDCRAACEAGWQVGMLAKHEAGGRSWYRLAPDESALAPSKYLEPLDHAGCVAVALQLVPHRALETLLQLGDVGHPTPGSPSLQLRPNIVRLGRAAADVLASDEASWLFRHSRAFREAHSVLTSRRGKTVLHNNVLIARVSDLPLKVALEKSLGGCCASLENDYLAFPCGVLSDVQRIVKKAGHVIKEVSARET